jgi:hypothetical protein
VLSGLSDYYYGDFITSGLSKKEIHLAPFGSLKKLKKTLQLEGDEF